MQTTVVNEICRQCLSQDLGTGHYWVPKIGSCKIFGRPNL